MATETTERSICTIVSGPPVKWTNGIYRNRYEAAIIRKGDTYTAAVHCLCGRSVSRDWKSYELAHSYMQAGIEQARACDPFEADTH